MTVIAWDGKTLAADKCSTNAGYGSTVTKIFKTEAGLFALSGTVSIAMEILEWVKAGAIPKDFPADARKDESSVSFIDLTGKFHYYTSGPYRRSYAPRSRGES